MSPIEILAPLTGVLTPLEEVPDPVFAGKMVGDGISIDPTSSRLLAPATGRIAQLQGSGHAVTITTDEGLEILTHIGVDTVSLEGKGFKALVRPGDRVQAGQPLIDFDLAFVAREAPSVLTEIIVTNGDIVASLIKETGPVEAGRSVIMRVTLKKAGRAGAAEPAAGVAVVSDPVTLPNWSGLHARPAAVLAAEAKRFVSDVRLLRGTDEANAKSVVSIMTLCTARGDAIRVAATGPDAADAAAAVRDLLAAGSGEDPSAQAESAPPAAAVAAVAVAAGEIGGAAASPGIVVGRAFQFRRDAVAVPEQGESVDAECERFDGAVDQAGRAIDAIRVGLIDHAKAAILAAHKELLSDPALIDPTFEGITSGLSAGFAWRRAYQSFAERLSKLDNPVLRERAADVRDVGYRVLALLAGSTEGGIAVPAGAILIASELAPSDTTTLDRTRVVGLCTTGGGPTSHVAIIARSLGLPAVCGIDAAALNVPDGREVILDGGRGILCPAPTEAQLAEARACMAADAERRAAETVAARNPARTSDGHRVEVAVNILNADDAREGVAAGAEGVGLFRSEFLFSDRAEAPDEEEQAAAYVAAAQALGPRHKLVIRTLDVGGDKPLAYLPLPKEDNPFLGLRGIRVSLDRPDLFRVQLRAILKAAPFADLHVMFPMVSSLDELRQAKALFEAERLNAGSPPVKIGIMVEVPAAAVMAERLATEVDFFSIGTNDLTQYTLAMDRGHAKLAKQADGLHPAVLRMIKLTADGAHACGRWVGVCGGLASDPVAAPLLVGLGVDELSVSTPAIASVKVAIGQLAFARCRALADAALALATAGEVRQLLTGS